MELFSSAEKFRETRASNRRSMSYNDIRDALPNRGLYISEQDLRVADLQEKGSCKKQSRSLSFTSVGLKEFASKKKAEEQLCKSLTSLNFRKSSTQSERGFLKAEAKDEKHRPRSPSFSFFSRNIKDLSNKGKRAENVAAGISDTVDATNNIASFLELPTRPLVSSPIVRRRSSSLSPVQKLKNESYEEPSMKLCPLPKICITPSHSDTEDVPVTSCMQGDKECQTLVDFFSENLVIQVDRGDEKRNDTPDEEFRNKRLHELKACENMKKHNKHHSTEKQQQVSKRSDIQEIKAEEPFEDFCEIRELKKGIHGMQLSKRKEDIDVVGQRRSTADDERDVETPVQAEKFLLNEARNSGSKDSFLANHITYYAVSPYEAREPWEITLYKGDEVKVEKKARSGWWLVQVNEDVGWAPSNFLADVTSTYQNEDSPVNDESGVNQGRKQPDCDGSEYESSDGSEDDNVDRGVDYDAAVCADDDDDDDDDGSEYDDGGKYEGDYDGEYDSHDDKNSNDSDRCDDDDDDDDDDADNDDNVFDSSKF